MRYPHMRRSNNYQSSACSATVVINITSDKSDGIRAKYGLNNNYTVFNYHQTGLGWSWSLDAGLIENWIILKDIRQILSFWCWNVIA